MTLKFCILHLTATAVLDFTPLPGVLTFAPGAGPFSAMIYQVALNNEQLVEADEVFTVTCEVIDGDAEFDNGQNSDSATVTILNDDRKLAK